MQRILPDAGLLQRREPRIWGIIKLCLMVWNQGRCRYSHDYDLTDEQLATLSKSAKQSPCWFLNNGVLLSAYRMEALSHNDDA
jgi:hypothetical protein